jgi:hypothetical protein
MNKKDLVFLNYSAAESSVSPDTIPTLVPEEKMKSILEGDENPFFKVESIDYPVKGTGGIYQEQFFESFKNVMNDRPIPGSKRGHTWESRPTSDLYTVGARMDKNGDGTGKIHMKIYIPPEGDSDSNAGLIRDAKANIVHFSLVTWPEYTVSKDDEGNEITYFTASKGYERNDAVEYGAGAMQQTVNSNDSGWLDKARSLIESGLFNTDDDSETPIRDGVVMRSALRRMVSRANAEHKTEIAELISMIDKNKGATTVTKKEIIEAVSAAIENNSLTLKELATAVNCEDRLLTKNHSDALAMAEQFAEIGVKDPVSSYKNMQDLIAKTEKARVENKLKSEFDPNGLGEKNVLLSYAVDKLGNTPEDKLDEAIAELKESPVAKNLAGQMADAGSEANQMPGYSDKSVKNEITGAPVLEL